MLEIACFNTTSAVLAAHYGAHRIELCAEYSAGGVTPAVSTLHLIREELDLYTSPTGDSRDSQSRIPINVMIRPRGGDFVYSALEFGRMKSEMQMFKASRGVDGFVFGILTSDNRIDEARNRELVNAASPLSCTFHRAVDEVADLDAAVDVIVKCGFTSILTSGGAGSAREGKARVAEMQKKFGARISIILGGGVRSTNVLELRKETGVEWLHSAAITGSEEEVDSEEVKRIIELLQNA